MKVAITGGTGLLAGTHYKLAGFGNDHEGAPGGPCSGTHSFSKECQSRLFPATLSSGSSSYA